MYVIIKIVVYGSFNTVVVAFCFVFTRLAITLPFLPVTVNPRILCFGKVCISIAT